jgi:hypothetical protein
MSLLSVVEIFEKIEKIAGPEARIDFAYNRIQTPNRSWPTITLTVIWPNAIIRKTEADKNSDCVYQYDFDVGEIKYSISQEAHYQRVINYIADIRQHLYPNQKI